MRQPKKKTVDELNTAGEREAVEAQARLVQENMSLVKKESLPVLEVVPNKTSGKDMTVARNNLNGQFAAKATALAMDTARRIRKVAFTPNAETGKTMVEEVAEAQLIVARDNPEPKNLGQVGSLIEVLDEISGQKMARQKMVKESGPTNPVMKVIITIPEGVLSMEERPPAPTQPSWINAETVYTNPPPPQRTGWNGANRRINPQVNLGGHDRRKS